MKTLSLNGKWRMKKTTDDEWMDAVVPGSVCNDLLSNGKIKDPYYRNNEESVLEAFKCDYEYERVFKVESELLQCSKVLLRCEGLDTIAKIKLNDKFIADTNNMNRIFEFNIREYLREGKNTIKIIFYSPVNYITKRYNDKPIWGANAMNGFPYIRKAHYMFGWDWGPQIPDMGIWRDISIIGIECGRFTDIHIRQEHIKGKVNLNIKAQIEVLIKEENRVQVKVICPDNKVIEMFQSVYDKKCEFNICIEKPELWWPYGYGEQPRYKVELSLKNEDNTVDYNEYKIGLRKMKIRKEKDQWGESFEFNVNDVSIFAMGADYIPEDNILSRCNKERTEGLIKDCLAANMNCIRVWGGGIYPEDYFYELCDKYGLVVWQDFMFACADYEMSEEFEENISREIEDNVKRIRHHACLGIWCGNNENESAIKFWGIKELREETRRDYIRQYEEVIPKVVNKLDPDTFYWPSSPSKGGNFENLDNENMGDNHYWDVWHGFKPFSEFKKYYFRFVSEFGFEAFPDIKTIESYTLPNERNPFSYVMESHQKCPGGNGKIVYYISEHLKYPSNLENIVYASQIMQAEAIRYGVEHWRRNRGRCMGTIYWQLNDCWPTASWASIDYYGRWKALHYYAKKFFNRILVSADVLKNKADIYAINETREDIDAVVNWRIKDNTSNIIYQGSKRLVVAALTSKVVKSIKITDRIKRRENYIEYSISVNGKVLSDGVELFTKPKHFIFLKPEISFEVMENHDKFVINVMSKNFAKYVELSLKNNDCRFSDNYFDIAGGEMKEITVNKEGLSLKTLKDQLRIRTIYDMNW